MINDVLDAILATIQSVDPVLRTVLAGVAIMLETSVLIGLVVPGDTVVIVASTAVSSPAEYWGLIVAVLVGALIGESAGFFIGRFFGPRLRRTRLARRIGEERLLRAERYLARRGGIAVFISRFLPVLHSLVPLTVGMSPMRYRVFLAWTAPACAIWAVAYVSVGSAVAEGYRAISSQLHWAGYLFVGAIVVAVVLFALSKKILMRIESRHMTEQDAEPPSIALPEAAGSADPRPEVEASRPGSGDRRTDVED